MLVRKFLHAPATATDYMAANLPPLKFWQQARYCFTKIPHGNFCACLPAVRRGCFCHGHSNCKYFVIPKTRTQWWTDKINGNSAKDEKAVKVLKKDGWKIINVWECDKAGES